MIKILNSKYPGICNSCDKTDQKPKLLSCGIKYLVLCKECIKRLTNDLTKK